MIIAKLALMANAIKQAIPWQVWAILGAILLAWLWGNSRYDAGRDDQLAKQDRAIVEAVMKAVKAEREAQAKFTEREQERETTTRDLREAAAKAEPGQKTRAVLETLRKQASKGQP